MRGTVRVMLDGDTAVVQARAAAADGSPKSGSPQGTGNTDVEALVQKALRRGYTRCQGGRCLFSVGCTPSAAPPASLQLPLSPSALGPSRPNSECTAEAPPAAAARPDTLTAARPAGMLPCCAAADPAAAGGTETSPTSHSMHQRGVAQEKLETMAEFHLLSDSSAAEDLQRLEKEAAVA